MTQVQPRIAIIGGGPGGLTLARILHVSGIAATVFEADTSPDSRRQGGSLDLHTESGLAALEAAGLMNEFDRFARPEDQGVRLYDKDGRCVYNDDDESHEGRPEIDRAQLRAILLRSLPSETVRWGSRVRLIQPAGEAFEVHLETGLASVFDLVIGADGTWSRTRAMVSPEMPAYSGISFVEMTIEDADRRHPDLSQMVGKGKIFALAEGRGLIAQRNSGGKLHVYVAQRVPESDLSALTLSSPDEARHWLIAYLEGWSPDLLAFIHASGDHIAARPIYAFPVGYRWPHRAGVTLLGDAAHVMSPFAGEGVNNAMLDALELAKAINGPDWRAGIRACEEGMFARIPESAQQSAEVMEAFLGPNGLENAVRIFTSFGPG